MRSSGATLALYCSISASVGVRFFWPPDGGVTAQAANTVLAENNINSFAIFPSMA
jgi:hypothetical protein